MCPCVTELGSQCVRPQILSDLRIHRADELPEGLDGVLLSDLHHDARADRHGLYHTDELRQDSLVDLEELLGRRLVQCEHLHRRDLEAFLQDCVDHLTSQAILYHVRLDDAASAVVEGRCGSELGREEEVKLPLVVGGAGRCVHGVPHDIGSEGGAQGAWRLFLGLGGVSWAQDASERLDGVSGHEFHTSDDVALHVGRQVCEERRSLVLLIKSIGKRWLGEFAHLEFGDCETVFVDSVDDLAGLNVTVWLDQRKGSACLGLKLILSEDVPVVDQLQLPGVHVDDGAEEELADGQPRAWHSFHEHSLVLEVVL